MKRINKMKVLVITLLMIGLVMSLFILVNDQVNQSNNQLIAANKVKTNQNKSANSVVKDELLTLVNFENTIPKDWKVDLVQLNNGQSVDRRIYDDLIAMLQSAKSEGLNPLICSSYRTNEKQEQLYQNKVSEYLSQGYSKVEASDKAAFWVARPGTSEHQLGLAVDIVSTKNQRLDRSQENTVEQQWLIQNSWKYGFVLRYPTNKNSITGVGYEPWHYRYVGKEHAKKINELGVCLEEYVK
ncbi:M15 family metallopeptidase [Thomasclavelia ramosa]|uniref:M15 family metallopeptidase n=1 Tax=Thomasclavelia ramosa TaxID=1547 RepID=UPI000E4A2597|nr:M15 family metallopeptidase [Thomasclavelia ramosa]RGQ36976.1 D-alanyl-D-alanine carboxypeptidase family protein [Thomasclavelia ramosa]RGQ48938.1 D-alanyl-D-alanine carboxypeptidase family protein [Thomasclavelia ramosa]